MKIGEEANVEFQKVGFYENSKWPTWESLIFHDSVCRKESVESDLVIWGQTV